MQSYIEVVFRPWYHFFDYDNHMYLNWPELSCCRLTKDYIRTAKANVADIVLYGLEAGYYTDVWADQYYIPDKPGYKRQHLSHNILIYGYNSEINVFQAMTYTKSEHYQPFELKPDDLLRACSSEYFNSVQLIKNNPDCQVTYDIRGLIEKLKRYISSGYELANNTKCSRYDPNQFVNFDACAHFPKYVADIAEKEHKIYIVCFYGYTEHKRCMGWRLEYIAKREGFEDGFFSEYREYAEKTSDRIMKLGMKFNITHNESVVPKIIKLMEELNAKEAEAVKAMLKRIDGL